MKVYPDCYVQDGEEIPFCYVLYHEDDEYLDLEERYSGNILQVIKTCRICGGKDVYYPL